MSMKGTPWYDMALDAGVRGEEAERMARLIEQDAQEEDERRQYEAWLEEQAAEDARLEALPPIIWPAGWNVLVNIGDRSYGWKWITDFSSDMVLTTKKSCCSAWLWARLFGDEEHPEHEFYPFGAQEEPVTEHVINLPVNVELGDVLILVFVTDVLS